LEGVARGSTKTTETKTYTGFVPLLPNVGYTLELPILPVGSGGTIELKAKIATGYYGQVLSNMVQISSTTAEQNPNDNIATATTSLGEIANLYTTVTFTPNYTLGADLEAVVHYGNNGNKDTSANKLTFHLDEHLTLKSSSLSGYELSGNILIWNIAQLPQGTSGTIIL
jgi:hypothetical protein